MGYGVCVLLSVFEKQRGKNVNNSMVAQCTAYRSIAQHQHHDAALFLTVFLVLFHASWAIELVSEMFACGDICKSRYCIRRNTNSICFIIEIVIDMVIIRWI